MQNMRGWKSCEIKGDGQKLAVLIAKKYRNNLGELVCVSSSQLHYKNQPKFTWIVVIKNFAITAKFLATTFDFTTFHPCVVLMLVGIHTIPLLTFDLQVKLFTHQPPSNDGGWFW